MGLYKRSDSPEWWYSYKPKGGKRLRGSTKTTSRREADKVFAAIRTKSAVNEALGITEEQEITLDAALGRYWSDYAHSQPSARNTRLISAQLLAHFGKLLLLSQLTDNLVAIWVAKRRSQVKDGTVLRDLAMLRAVMRRAENLWGYRVAKIRWSDHAPPEPDSKERILSDAEEDALIAATRPDYVPLFRAALASGIRVGNLITLTWRQVDWDRRLIRLRGKSKKQGGKVIIIPITQQLAEILAGEQGNHPMVVFTYIQRQTARVPASKQLREAGQRYPFSPRGWTHEWYRVLKEIGLEDFRFHDLRHTAATRVLAETGNLQIVQQMLGHSLIATTQRYAKTSVDQVREAMDQADSAALNRKIRAQKQSRTSHAVIQGGKK